jgi:hypothetical protein
MAKLSGLLPFTVLLIVKANLDVMITICQVGMHCLVKKWLIRQWTVVIGDQ